MNDMKRKSLILLAIVIVSALILGGIVLFNNKYPENSEYQSVEIKTDSTEAEQGGPDTRHIEFQPVETQTGEEVQLKIDDSIENSNTNTAPTGTDIE